MESSYAESQLGGVSNVEADTYRFRQGWINVGILDGKRQACAETPTAIQHEDGPKEFQSPRPFIVIGKISMQNIVAMQTHLVTQPGR